MNLLFKIEKNLDNCPICQKKFHYKRDVRYKIRKHIRDIHNMSADKLCPKITRWDNDTRGRIKSDEERIQRTRENKRKWACKNRVRKRTLQAAIVLISLANG